MPEHNSTGREQDESIIKLSFEPDGLLPNNPQLPAVLYKGFSGTTRKTPNRSSITTAG